MISFLESNASLISVILPLIVTLTTLLLPDKTEPVSIKKGQKTYDKIVKRKWVRISTIGLTAMLILINIIKFRSENSKKVQDKLISDSIERQHQNDIDSIKKAGKATQDTLQANLKVYQDSMRARWETTINAIKKIGVVVKNVDGKLEISNPTFNTHAMIELHESNSNYIYGNTQSYYPQVIINKKGDNNKAH